MNRFTPDTIQSDDDLIDALSEKLDLLGISYGRLFGQAGSPLLEMSDGTLAMPESVRATRPGINEFIIVGSDETCRRLSLHEAVAWIAAHEKSLSDRRRHGA